MNVADWLLSVVFERNDSDIGLLADVECADQVIEVEGFGSADGGGLEHVAGSDESLRCFAVARRQSGKS